MSDYAPDAVLKMVRNLKVGMKTKDYGTVLEIKKGKGGYYDVVWDGPVSFAHPCDLLVTVVLPRG